MGSACGTITELRKAAQIDAMAVTDRLGRYEAAMTAASAKCDAVPGALDGARSELAEAEGSKYSVREKATALLRSIERFAKRAG